MMTKMTQSYVLIVLVTFMTTVALVHGQSSYCPDITNSTGPLAFVDPYPEQPVVQVALTSFFLSCCSGDRPNVTSSWFKWMPKENRWCPQKQTEKGCVDWNYRHTSDNGQTMVFEDAGVVDDSGRYFCNATDGQTTINRTFDLLVVDCVYKPDKIDFAKPIKPQASAGSKFIQGCEGNFGCYGAVANDSLAWWSYIDEQGHLHNLSVGTHRRYNIEEIISQNETNKGAVLTIQPVEEEDFSRTFICSLKMRNLPTEGFRFSLTKLENKISWLTLIVSITTSTVAFVLVCAVGLLTWYLYHPMISFKLKSLTSRLPKRGSQHKFDVILFSREDVEEEEEVRNTMETKLREKGYRIFRQRAGAEMKEVDAVETCVSVIFIIHTPNLTTFEPYLNRFDFCFTVGTEAKTNIIFVPTQSMSTAQWEMLSEYKVYSHMAKLCTVAVWPGQKGQASRRLRANFWCQVQCRLPKPQHPRVQTNNISTQSDSYPSETTPLTENSPT